MTLLRSNNFFSLFIATLLASCSGKHFLPKGEKLYTGAKIELKSSEKIKNKNYIRNNAGQVLRPEPNRSFLGMRPRLWFYYVAGDSANKGFRKWIKNKLGEPPVLMSDIDPNLNTKYIDAKLFNIGIFNAATSFEIKEKKRTGEIIYTFDVHNPFIIKNIKYPEGTNTLNPLIISSMTKSLVKPGDNYNLTVLKMERQRIDAMLKDEGYFYFNPDYLLFKADTNENDKTVDLELSIKEETPDKALRIYRINDVLVDPEYSIGDDTTNYLKDTMVVNDVIFLSTPKIRPKVILRSVFFRKNDIYSRTKHNLTLNRIMSMGNYKYANLKFTEADMDSTGFLNARLLLTPMPKRTFRSEISLVSKSNDFIGPKLNINYRNRNEFKGAELLNVNLGGSFETQFTGKYKNLYSYEFNPQVELYIPKFLVPIKIKHPSSYYIPKTKIALGYNYLVRI